MNWIFIAVSSAFFLSALGLWAWAIFDCLLNEPPGSAKFAWLLVVLFLVVPGAMAYVVIRRPERRRLALEPRAFTPARAGGPPR